MADGSGKLPFPKNLTDLRKFISEDTRKIDFKIQSKVIPLGKLRPWIMGLDQVGEDATGSVKILLSGSLALPEVDVDIELRNIHSPAKPWLPKTDVFVKMDAREDVAKFSAKALAKDYAPVTIEAELPFFPKKWASDPDLLMAETIRGKLQVPRLDLARFQALIPNARRLQGTLTGFAGISGKLGSPEVKANLKLTGGRLEMNGNTLPNFGGVHFELTSDLKRIDFKGGADDLAGGNLMINGHFKLGDDVTKQLGDLNLTLTGRGLPVARNEYLIMRTNADLKIKGPLDSALIAGNVGIIDSVFYKDIELIPIGRPFLEPAAAKLPAMDMPTDIGDKVPEYFRSWSANVSLKTVDPILIRGNLGQGRIAVDLRISGKLGDPIPNGEVTLNRARIRLPFSTLQVAQGTLKFNARTKFDPVIELRGDARMRPYQVDIYAYGRASDPQLVLVSQPPLPKEEIMTLLATGTTSSGLENSQQATSRASQLFIEELRRGRFLFGKQLRPLLGLLDDVDFSIADPDPYSSSTYNSASLQLSNRWSISAGVDVEGDQRMMATWRLRFK
jgi:autotransporter translocation and assembly factor TamB